MANASDDFAAALTDAQIELNQLSEDARRRVVRLLRLLHADLEAAVRSARLDSGTLGARRSRTEKLIRDVEKLLQPRYTEADSVLTRVLRDIAEFSRDRVVGLINDVFAVSIAKATLTKADLKALVNDLVVLGEPTKDWWEGQATNTRRRFAREVRLGVAQGQTTEEIVRRVRGEPTGRMITVTRANGKSRRILEYSGGVLNTTANEARALVTTAVQSIANEAMQQTYNGNEDILRGYAAVTTLDNRTSKICMARTGAAWDLQGNPLPESTTDEPFPGFPPWHYYCRTVLSPLTKTWEQLVEESTGQRRRLLNTVPDSVRVSFDGLVGSEVRSFDDWLRVRGDAFAKRKLGPTLFGLWKKGKITTQTLIDQQGRPRTVEQIRRLVGI